MVYSQPHVAIFLRYLGGGGAETILLNLAQNLSQQNCQVDLVLGKAWGRHLQKVAPTVNIVDLGASNLFSTVASLTRYLKEKQPTSVLSALHYANEITICAKRLANVPTRVVISEHNTLSQSLQQQNRLKKRLIPLFVKYLYPWADGIIACSHGVAKDLAQLGKLPLEKIRPIYNPVISPTLLEKAQEPPNHSWFQPGEPPVILGVGKLEAQKDFPTLIRAFAQVRKVKPARLVILGWGQERSQLEALAQALGVAQDVDFPGYVDNPYAYMARAKVFALSSAWEGLPTVLIEALAVGTPVVSTNCPSGAAEILNNGQYGLLTSVGNAETLAEAILNVFSRTSHPVVDSTWLDQFCFPVITQQYCEVLGISLTKSYEYQPSNS